MELPRWKTLQDFVLFFNIESFLQESFQHLIFFMSYLGKDGNLEKSSCLALPLPLIGPVMCMLERPALLKNERTEQEKLKC